MCVGSVVGIILTIGVSVDGSSCHVGKNDASPVVGLAGGLKVGTLLGVAADSV